MTDGFIMNYRRVNGCSRAINVFDDQEQIIISVALVKPIRGSTLLLCRGVG
jgi:hypothetical protein